ncbi:MAG: hypothetical protein KBC33_02100 [Candidatus Pacebacteria bacterium]|nr:hypothetical protein [Candidatus Paceibacterota bacterium]
MATESKGVSIQCGANSQTIDLGEGETLTVGDIRKRLGDVLNIAPTSLAIVRVEGGEDENVDDDRVVKNGDTVQFVKQSGSKG